MLGSGPAIGVVAGIGLGEKHAAAAVDGEARPGSDLDDLQVLVVLPEESGHERRVAEVHPERRRGARSQRWRARCLHQEISP